MSTAGRRLETLSVLQARPGITGPELATRLGVTERTVRRDLAQLRELGYRIDGLSGRSGGYRLAQGRAMPPLLLDADEVAAVALGLRTPAGVDGLEAATVTALAKLTQVVPARWQTRLAALSEVETLRGRSSRQTESEVLVPLALACRGDEGVRIRHRRQGAGETRAIELQPHRLITLRRLWYLVACPRGTQEWQVYAVDRIEHVQPLGIRLPAPDPPPDPAALVATTLAGRRSRYQVHVRVHTSADLVRDLVAPDVATVTADPVDDTGCDLRFGTDDLDWAARWLTYLDLDLDVIEPAALTTRLHHLGRWLTERYPS